jgi:hypothetical protein
MRLKELFDALTRQQRIALIAVSVMNAFIFIAAFILLFRETPPEPLIWPDVGAPCEAYAAASFRQLNVAASVTITREAMFVTIDGPSTQAWDVFSATARIANLGCGPYNLVRVDVPDPDGRPNVRLTYELTGPELQLWLDSKSSDVELAERMRRQVYQTAPLVTPTP